MGPYGCRFCGLVFWLLLGLASPALAQAPRQAERDAIVARAWLDDPSGKLTPQAALGRAWTPFEGPFARGYAAGATWLRLAIDPTVLGASRLPADQRLVLRIQPAHLDEVAVFRTDRPGEPPRVVGDRYAQPDPYLRSLDHVVVIPDATAPFDILLRLRTVSNHSIHVQALSWDDARQAESRQRSLVVAYLVFVVMVLAWAGFAWLDERDRTLRVFLGHQVALLLLSISLLGVARLLTAGRIPARAIDLITSGLVPAQVVLAIMFHSALLRDLGIREPDWKLLRACALAPVTALLLIWAGLVRQALLLTQVTVVLLTLLMIVIAWRVRPVSSGEAGLRRRGVIVAIYVLMAAFLLPPWLRVLGVLHAGAWSYSGFMLYGVVDTLLLGTLLKYRAWQARLQRDEAAAALAQAQREAEMQRARGAEQSELMTMLTHELKTPLSVFSLALGNTGQLPQMRERALRAVENMRSVIDRCSQAARLDDEVPLQGVAPVLTPLALDDVLAEAVRCQFEGARIDRAVAEDLPACLADRQLLLVIIGNLLENAVKYGPPGARIQASVGCASHQGHPGVVLRVANPVGPAGRPDPAQVFQKYHRGGHARRQTGSGLGLYLSRRLALRLGGQLSLCEGDNVSFELWLPA